jgi:hypothetical protein
VDRLWVSWLLRLIRNVSKSCSVVDFDPLTSLFGVIPFTQSAQGRILKKAKSLVRSIMAEETIEMTDVSDGAALVSSSRPVVRRRCASPSPYLRVAAPPPPHASPSQPIVLIVLGAFVGAFITSFVTSYINSHKPAPEAPQNATQLAIASLNALYDSYWQWTLRTFPEEATYLGDSRFNDAMTDMSLQAISTPPPPPFNGAAARADAFRNFSARARTLRPDDLKGQDLFSYEIFLRVMDASLRDFNNRLYLMPVTQVPSPSPPLLSPALKRMLKSADVGPSARLSGPPRRHPPPLQRRRRVGPRRAHRRHGARRRSDPPPPPPGRLRGPDNPKVSPPLSKLTPSPPGPSSSTSPTKSPPTSSQT